ncbi:MAG: DUF4136 domain-containing protein [Pseudomonadota bacterium]
MSCPCPGRAVRVGLLAALAAAGCATSTYTGDYNFSVADGAAFANYETYAWQEQESSFTRTAVVADDRGLTNELLLRQTIEKALDRRGFAKADGQPPDFYYAYRAAVFEQVNQEIVDRDDKRAREEEIRDLNEGTVSQDGFAFSRATLYRGTLKLLVIDAASGRQVWSGTDSQFVETFRGSHAGGRLSVRGLLEQFPPDAP